MKDLPHAAPRAYLGLWSGFSLMTPFGYAGQLCEYAAYAPGSTDFNRSPPCALPPRALLSLLLGGRLGCDKREAREAHT